MRRLLSWAFTFSTVVSAALFVCACALWARSYWVAEFLNVQHPLQTSRVCEVWGVTSNRGILRVGWQDGNLVVGRGVEYKRLPTFQWGGQTTFWQRLGFAYDARENVIVPPHFYGYWAACVPHWAVASPLALMPAAWLALRLRRRGARPRIAM